MSEVQAFNAVLRRDLTLAYRQPSAWINPLLFFIIVVSLFPLGVGPEPNTLRDIGPGVIWAAALLAALLGQDGLFRGDFEDGSLEQLILSPYSFIALSSAKVLAHWLMTGLPLILLSPLLGLMMGLSSQAILALAITLALGTPVLSLLGAIGAALVVNLSRGGVLLALVVLPLCIPVLIFATVAVTVEASGLSASGYYSLLGAALVLAITLAPVAIAAGLRIGIGGA